MIDKDAASRELILTKLAQSRAQVRAILDPPKPEPGSAEEVASGGHSGFPRSRTMQALLSSKGLGATGALIGGLILARPALALRMLRMVPAGAVGKMLLVKGLEAFRSRRQSRTD
jgi:hypothetical protein